MSIDTYIEQMIKDKVEAAVREQLTPQPVIPDNAKPVYTDRDIMEMLHIDRKTLKKYRDEGLIGYTHPHDKYFYSHQDLMDFMANENIRYDAFNIK